MTFYVPKPKSPDKVAYLLRIYTFIVAMVVCVVAVMAQASTATAPVTHESYSTTLAAKHDCWTSGRSDMPTAAVVTYRSNVTARFVTDPRKVTDALNYVFGAHNSRIYSVTALCLKDGRK